MAGYQWQSNIGKFSFHHMEIRATDAADMNLDEDLTRLWKRYRSIVKSQRTSRYVIGMVKHHRFHACRSLRFLGLNAFDIQMDLDFVSDD